MRGTSSITCASNSGRLTERCISTSIESRTPLTRRTTLLCPWANVLSSTLPTPAKFVSDNFHIMDSVEAFVVEPLQHKHLEIHVFVTDDCPEDAGGVERLMRMDFMVDHWDIFDEKWLSLIVIYNLPSVPAINTWLAK